MKTVESRLVTTRMSGNTSDNDGASAAADAIENEVVALEEVEKPTSQDTLDGKHAMELARYWYATLGPYRHMYRIRPINAYENEKCQWSIKFTVVPATNVRYFRRFHYSRSEGTTEWEVTHWSDDAEHPASADFDPDDYDDDDEMETLEEEELLGHEEDNSNELDELNADAELSIEELKKKYGLMDDSVDAAESSESLPEERDGKRKRSPSGSPHDETTTRHSNGNEDSPVVKKKTKVENDGGVFEDSIGHLPSTPLTPKGRERRRRSFTSSYAETEEDVKRETEELLKSNALDMLQSDPDSLIVKLSVPHSTFLNLYFHPSSHEEDTEIYSSRLGNQNTIRIGAQYQADLNTISNEASQLEGLCECLWEPHPNLNLVDYTKKSTSEAFRPGCALEAALTHLHACDYNLKRAEKEPQLCAPVEIPWSLKEMDTFESGLAKYGKAFGLIRNDLSSRTHKELVEFYHYWKKTTRYDAFVARYRGYKGISRPKDLLRPGNANKHFVPTALNLDAVPISTSCLP